MDDAGDATLDTEERTALIHREIFQLGGLIALAIVAFLVTRAIALSNREMTLRDAAEWFHRGERAMQTGHVDTAIDALRRATVRDRENKRYVLTLAQALARNEDDDGARSVLLTLRDSDPEDREVNLQLARLAGARQDVAEALRFYHNALYAPWPIELNDVRRAVRIELVRFLLGHREVGRALAELLALSADMPDDLSQHLTVAQLFADAGDHAHALDQFQRALRLDPVNRVAIAGAGVAAFRLANYADARSLLRRLPPDAPEGREIRELADLVLSRDPLATRLGSTERRQRLVADVAYVDHRVQTCIENGNRSEESAAMANEAKTLAAQLAKPGGLEQDTVEAGVDLIDRLEAEIIKRCGAPTPLDQALALMGRRHRADPR